jgi:hypothetical protein
VAAFILRQVSWSTNSPSIDQNASIGYDFNNADPIGRFLNFMEAIGARILCKLFAQEASINWTVRIGEMHDAAGLYQLFE